MRVALIAVVLVAVVALSGVEAARKKSTTNLRDQPGAWPNPTPLDDYVNKPDDTYNWTIANTVEGFDYDIYQIFLTSQTWLTAEDSTKPVWQHWLQICVPHVYDSEIDTAMMYIDGGSSPSLENLPSVDFLTTTLCVLTGSVAAHLSAIPNEPITFYGDPKNQSRTEDEIIAYTWEHFMYEQNEPNWLLRLPMVKAAVKALDCIQEFVATQPQLTPVTNFLVGGASKRGWTTWMVGAVDKRVSAILPIVAPVGNLVPQMNLQFQAYGNWSFALINYVQQNVTFYINNPNAFQPLLDIVGPDAYADRLTMPIFSITDTGDEFFMPDGIAWMWPSLSQPKWMRIVADAEHSLTGHQIDVLISDAAVFYHSLAKGYDLPHINWTVAADGTSITAWVTTVDGSLEIQPSSVIAWHGYNAHARDFRLVTCGGDQAEPEGGLPIHCINPIVWLPEPVLQSENGTWTAKFDVPSEGWLGFMLEFEYNDLGELSGIDPFKITTEISIIPQTLPYPPCGDACNQPLPTPPSSSTYSTYNYTGTY